MIRPWGLFPAAVTLSENGFDLLDLLERPGSGKGGPNLHSTSILTWFTAAVIRLLGQGPALFPFLHLVHLGIFGVGLYGVFRFAQPALGTRQSLLLSGAVMLCPLTLTQAGYLYFDMPVAVCGVWAALAWSRQRLATAVVWSSLAVLIKESGLVVPAALAVAALLENRAPRERAIRAAWLTAFPLLDFALQLGVFIPVEKSSSLKPLPYFDYLRDGIWERLAYLPDLVAIFALFFAAAIARAPQILRALRASPATETSDADSETTRRYALAVLLVTVFVAFYLLVPLTGIEIYLLPRYFVQIVPFLLFGLAVAVGQRFGRRAASVFLATLAIFFALNRNGDFLGIYPPVPGNDMSIAERSAEYRDLLALQRETVAALSALPPDVTVYYGLAEHFMLSHPLLGYADAPPAGGRSVAIDPPPQNYERASDFPMEFYLLHNYAGLGHFELQLLQAHAEAHPRRDVRVVRVFERGPYRATLVHVTPRPKP